MKAEDFKSASHAVWEAMAPGWDDRHSFFEHTARPVTERMLERLAPTAGDTILDLAAGTGVVGFAAAAPVGPDGRVIVSDFSEAMVAVAARTAQRLGLANVECRVLDAERLAMDDDAVDGVLCRWGYMLMGDPAAALTQTRRVLRRGGRLAFAVFAGPEQNPWAALPSRILQERGHMPPPEAGAPGILALADRARLQRLVTDAGFADLHVEEVPFTFTFRDMEDYWQFLTEVAGAIAGVLDRLDADELRAVRAGVADDVPAFTGADGIALPALSLVVSAA